MEREAQAQASTEIGGVQTLEKTKILVINTGGRGGIKTDASGHHVPGYLQAEMSRMDELRRDNMPRYDVQKLTPLRHSADIGSSDWTRLALLIRDQYHSYQGFVIVHGSDTMCYSAAALSFMFMNLGKPIIFTGALISMDSVHSDLKRNLILSLLFAACEQLCEVCIVFAERLFRANRTTKISSVSLQPFASPSFPALASMRGKHIHLDHSRLRPAPKGRLVLYGDMSEKIFAVKLVPNMTKEHLIAIVRKTAARGIVLAAFGSGNCPIRNGAVHAAALIARERGIVVIICSQVRFGAVELAAYEAGRHLLSAGVVGTENMTLEATVVKLKYLLGRGFAPHVVKELMPKNLRGEVTSQSTHSKL